MNEAPRIERCVRSLAEVCADITVVDSHSTDATREIAAASGARVIERDWDGYAGQKNFAIQSAPRPWVLLLDADEWLTPRLVEEIRALFAAGEPRDMDGFAIPRRNIFLGRELQGGLLGHERLVRLFRNDFRYLDMRVHESFALEGRRIGSLENGFLHENDLSLEAYRQKLARYAQLVAQEKSRKGKSAHWWDLYLRPPFHFFKNYVLRAGFRDGREGLILEKMNARYVREKYARLRAIEEKPSD